MGFFASLQESAFAQWVAGSPSLLAYPTVLTLHTVGMAIVVGTCVVMDLRLLGIGADVPLSALAGALGTVTLMMRLVGGVAAGSAADRWDASRR